MLNDVAANNIGYATTEEGVLTARRFFDDKPPKINQNTSIYSDIETRGAVRGVKNALCVSRFSSLKVIYCIGRNDTVLKSKDNA